MKYTILMFLAALVFFQCDQDDSDVITQPFDLGQSFEVQTGTVYSERNGSLSLNLNSIVSDSRCPKDVSCEANGSAEAAFFFQDDQTNRTDTLSSVTYRGPYPDSALFQGYIIKFLEVDTEAKSAVTIQQDDYRLRIIVTKQ